MEGAGSRLALPMSPTEEVELQAVVEEVKDDVPIPVQASAPAEQVEELSIVSGHIEDSVVDEARAVLDGDRPDLYAKELAVPAPQATAAGDDSDTFFRADVFDQCFNLHMTIYAAVLVLLVNMILSSSPCVS